VSARFRIEEVLRFLELEADALLVELRDEGLFERDEVSSDEAEELRVAATLVRELGVNPAGVAVALHLRRRLLCLEERTRALLRRLEHPDSER
jgi:hypothetical protein